MATGTALYMISRYLFSLPLDAANLTDWAFKFGSVMTVCKIKSGTVIYHFLREVDKQHCLFEERFLLKKKRNKKSFSGSVMFHEANGQMDVC